MIGGYTQEEGYLAALLVGGYHGRQLHYVGEVALGLRALRDSAVLRELPSLLTAHSPFVDLRRKRSAIWLRPHLVADVGYQEWLRGWELRHASNRGLRGSRPVDCRLPERWPHINAFSD